MLTRRTFMHSAGVLAAGMAGGVASPAEIKEHGVVELRAWFFSKNPIVLKSTIFSDERRDVFGVRILGVSGAHGPRLAELRLPSIREAVSRPGWVRKCVTTAWEDDNKQDGFLEVISREGKLVFSPLGQLDESPRPGPIWLDLSDVRQVL